MPAFCNDMSVSPKFFIRNLHAYFSQYVSVLIDKAKMNISLDVQSQMRLCFLDWPKLASTGL